MPQWYYADASGQRHGPFSAEELEGHVRHARLGPASLVWREGLQDWQPLSAVAAELDLPLDTLAAPAADVAVPAADAPYTPPTADLASFQPVVAGHLVHAGLWKRFAASFIDSIVTTIFSYALMIPLMLIGVGVMGAGGSDNPFATGAGLASMLAIYPVLFLAPCVYFGWMQSSSLQASLGKLAVGIKVTRTDGQRMSFWRGFLRSLAYLVFTMVTCGLGVLISSVSQTQGQAIQLAVMTLLPQVLLSGLIFPLTSIVVGVRWIAYLLPLTYFTEISRGVMLRAEPIGSLWPPFVYLALLGAVVTGLAIWRFHAFLAPGAAR